MDEVTRYPIDYDTVNKGDVLPVEQVEEITQCKSDHFRYSLEVAKLCARLQNDLIGMGRPIMVVQRKRTVAFLTDEDAARYGDLMFRQYLRRFGRQHHATAITVDVTQLSEENRAAHERAMLVNGKTLQGALLSRREAIKALPHKRQTPGLSEK